MADEPIVVSPTPDPKPGWKTSEFWVTVAGSLVAILNSAFGWHIPADTILTVVAGIAAYVFSRGLAKKPAPVVAP